MVADRDRVSRSFVVVGIQYRNTTRTFQITLEFPRHSATLSDRPYRHRAIGNWPNFLRHVTNSPSRLTATRQLMFRLCQLSSQSKLRNHTRSCADTVQRRTEARTEAKQAPPPCQACPERSRVSYEALPSPRASFIPRPISPLGFGRGTRGECPRRFDASLQGLRALAYEGFKASDRLARAPFRKRKTDLAQIEFVGFS